MDNLAFFIYVGNYIKSVFLVWTFKNYMQIVKCKRLKYYCTGMTGCCCCQSNERAPCFFFYFGGPGGAVQCPKNKLLRSQKQHHYRIEGKPVCQNGRGVQSCPPTEEAVNNATKSIGYESKTTLFTWEVKENPW